MSPTSPRPCAAPCVWTPDIMLVGEMRDLATIHAAIEAGRKPAHVVFATLHTSGAAQQPSTAWVDPVFPKEQQDQVRTQLSTALIGVLSQALLAAQSRRA